MKTPIFILLLTFTTITLYGQNSTSWTFFYNKKATLVGFKDSKGIVKIKPKFATMTPAVIFDDIMAAIEEKNEKWETYYLTQSGRIVGRDSLYYFDNSPDCENEGFIRFHDPKTDKMGLFDKDGNIAIPAEYSHLSKVKNGLIKALKNATKTREKNDDEHWFWTGGQTLLIDTKNNTILTDFPADKNLNLFSIQKSKTASTDPIRQFFKGVDGEYYSFIDFEKEFKQWISNDLLVHLTAEKLAVASLDSINWQSTTANGKTEKHKYIIKNFSILQEALLEINNPKCDYFVSFDGLNPFIFEDESFGKYFNNCGEAKDWQYPTLSLIINHTEKKDLKQNNFEFLRTEEGYKLISVTIRN